MNDFNVPGINLSSVNDKIRKDKEVVQIKKDNKIKQLIKLAIESNLPQIILDSFENDFNKKIFNFEIDNDILKEYAIECYKNNNELINKLPHEVATCFIYDYCTEYDRKNVIIDNYNYYKGYKNIFYLLHGYHSSGIFIIYNGISLQKDTNKYISDFSWGAIDLTGYENTYGEKKRISSNAVITAEVIFNAIFPENEEKHNLIDIFLESFLAEKTSYQRNSSFSKQDIIEWYNQLNLIKKVCIEQKLTYREFGEKVGFGEGAIKNAAATGKISDQLKKAIEMFLEIIQLRKENIKFKEFQKLMKEVITL